MNRKGNVFYEDRLCGIIEETETGYRFSYDLDYINDLNAKAVSMTLPLSKSAYSSNTMFPFFDGLIPEGWLLDIAEKYWKINERDRMGLLLTCCNDCIGAVSVNPIITE